MLFEHEEVASDVGPLHTQIRLPVSESTPQVALKRL
jgi:hypothetical protein